MSEPGPESTTGKPSTNRSRGDSAAHFLEIDINSLSPKHRAVAVLVESSPSLVSFGTAAELARRANVSESTVVRFAQELGFESYRDFRQNIRHKYLGTLTPLREYKRNAGAADSVMTVVRRQALQDVNNLQGSLETLHERQLERLVRAITAARNIVVVSGGSYSSVAHVLVHMLRFLGISAVVEDREAPNVTAALLPLDENDLVIGISFYRVVKSTANALVWARKRGIPTVAITDTVYSPLSQAADTSLIVSTESFSFFQSMVAPLSLVYAIAAYIGITADEKRQQLMQEGLEGFEVFKPFYS